MNGTKIDKNHVKLEIFNEICENSLKLSWNYFKQYTIDAAGRKYK